MTDRERIARRVNTLYRNLSMTQEINANKEMRELFTVAAGATPEQIRQVVAFLEERKRRRFLRSNTDKKEATTEKMK